MDEVKLLPCDPLRERVRDFIYDATKDEFSVGWTLSAHQTDDLIDIVREATRPTLVTDEVVERVADAMRKAPALGPTVRGYPTGEIVDYDMLARAAIAARPAIPPQSLGDVRITREQYAFLMGEGPLEGVWFGDLNEGLKGAFWWRALLRCAAGWPAVANDETPTHGPAIDQDGGER